MQPFSSMKIYGIPNCNTVKKARTWLSEHNLDVPFHDFKKQGVTPELLQGWCRQAGYEKLLNRQGTTWRQLPDEIKAGINNEQAAIALMLEKPSIIKRPVLEYEQGILLGFDEAAYTRLLK